MLQERLWEAGLAAKEPLGKVRIGRSEYLLIESRTPEDQERAGRHTSAIVMQQEGIAEQLFLTKPEEEALYSAVRRKDGSLSKRAVRI